MGMGQNEAGRRAFVRSVDGTSFASKTNLHLPIVLMADSVVHRGFISVFHHGKARIKRVLDQYRLAVLPDRDTGAVYLHPVLAARRSQYPTLPVNSLSVLFARLSHKDVRRGVAAWTEKLKLERESAKYLQPLSKTGPDCK